MRARHMMYVVCARVPARHESMMMCATVLQELRGVATFCILCGQESNFGYCEYAGYTTVFLHRYIQGLEDEKSGWTSSAQHRLYKRCALKPLTEGGKHVLLSAGSDGCCLWVLTPMLSRCRHKREAAANCTVRLSHSSKPLISQHQWARQHTQVTQCVAATWQRPHQQTAFSASCPW